MGSWRWGGGGGGGEEVDSARLKIYITIYFKTVKIIVKIERKGGGRKANFHLK